MDGIKQRKQNGQETIKGCKRKAPQASKTEKQYYMFFYIEVNPKIALAWIALMNMI